MARVVEDGDLGKVQYPWDKWTDQRVWEVTQGEDFQVEMHSFKAMLYAKAKALKLKVTCKVEGDRIRFQFRGGDDSG